MKADRGEAGFSLLELIVGLAIFSVVSVAFYQLLFSSTSASEETQDIVNVSEEARLGFNRMLRDIRQSSELTGPTATSFTVQIDFNANGTIEPTPSPGPELGNFEQLTYTFTSSPTGNGTIRVSSGALSEVLMRGVDCIRKADNSCHDVFTYGSSRLEWDTNGDGRTQASELATAVGNGLPLDGSELGFVDIVEVSLNVRVGETRSNYYAEAQLRNLR